MPKTTFLKVKNRTSERITIKIYSIDAFDWGSDERPDKNFHNRVIRPHGEIIQPECINLNATANLFTMDIVFADETCVTCRIDQGLASGRSDQLVEYMPTGDPNRDIGPAFVALVANSIYEHNLHRERGILGGRGGSNEKYAVTLSVKDDTVIVDVHLPRST